LSASKSASRAPSELGCHGVAVALVKELVCCLPRLILFHSLAVFILWEDQLYFHFNSSLVDFLGNMRFFFVLAALAMFVGQGGEDII
jgi:hypothetical protein